jgi:ATP-dependent DNA helicase RecG
MNIKGILAKGESETIEFKESFDKEFIETAVAFANTKGGRIFIGIDDKGKIKGIQLGKKTLDEWVNQVSQTTEPKISMKSEKFSVKEKKIILFHILENRIKPVSFKGRYFKRVGSSNRQMGWEDITKLVLESAGTTWDSLIEPQATLEDIDLEKVKKFVGLCNKTGRRPVPENEKPLTTLEKLELIQKGKPTKAAILLFVKHPQRFYLQAILKMGRFKSETIIIDDKEIRGTLFEQIEEAMLYFRDRLQTKFEFTGEPQRKVVWEYPLEALRETVINAVCHRDYLDSANTQIRIYDDHILVWNPGKLPPDLSLEQLKSEHPSRPHNRLIAEAFFYAGYIEKWGGGTLKIIRECIDGGLPEPQFSEDMGMFGVTFRKDILTEKNLRELGLNNRQIKAVMYVKEKGKITNTEYQEIAKVSKPTATRDLSKLVSKNILEQIGITGKGTQYTLKGSQTAQTTNKGLTNGSTK